jgi:hypothetical protein
MKIYYPYPRCASQHWCKVKAIIAKGKEKDEEIIFFFKLSRETLDN